MLRGAVLVSYFLLIASFIVRTRIRELKKKIGWELEFFSDTLTYLMQLSAQIKSKTVRQSLPSASDCCHVLCYVI